MKRVFEERAARGEGRRLQLLLGHVFAELLGDSLQVLEGDLACSPQAEGCEEAPFSQLDGARTSEEEIVPARR